MYKEVLGEDSGSDASSHACSFVGDPNDGEEGHPYGERTKNKSPRSGANHEHSHVKRSPSPGRRLVGGRVVDGQWMVVRRPREFQVPELEGPDLGLELDAKMQLVQKVSSDEAAWGFRIGLAPGDELQEVGGRKLPGDLPAEDVENMLQSVRPLTLVFHTASQAAIPVESPSSGLERRALTTAPRTGSWAQPSLANLEPGAPEPAGLFLSSDSMQLAGIPLAADAPQQNGSISSAVARGSLQRSPPGSAPSESDPGIHRAQRARASVGKEDAASDTSTDSVVRLLATPGPGERREPSRTSLATRSSVQMAEPCPKCGQLVPGGVTAVLAHIKSCMHGSVRPSSSAIAPNGASADQQVDMSMLVKETLTVHATMDQHHHPTRRSKDQTTPALTSPEVKEASILKDIDISLHEESDSSESQSRSPLKSAADPSTKPAMTSSPGSTSDALPASGAASSTQPSVKPLALAGATTAGALAGLAAGAGLPVGSSSVQAKSSPPGSGSVGSRHGEEDTGRSAADTGRSRTDTERSRTETGRSSRTEESRSSSRTSTSRTVSASSPSKADKDTGRSSKTEESRSSPSGGSSSQTKEAANTTPKPSRSSGGSRSRSESSDAEASERSGSEDSVESRGEEDEDEGEEEEGEEEDGSVSESESEDSRDQASPVKRPAELAK